MAGTFGARSRYGDMTANTRALRDRLGWRLHRMQVRLTRPFLRARLCRAPIDPNYGFNRGRPVDRYYIERFLSLESEAIKGDVLEIEHDVYARRFGGERVARLDILHVDPGFPRATIAADLTDAPHIPGNRFDCLIIVQTLQYIYDVGAAIRTMRRILKPGGTALVTVPTASRLHASASDAESGEYWRFTSMATKRLFGDVFGPANVRITSYGNLAAATAGFAGLAAEDLTRGDLERHDPLYEYLIAVRADKAA